MSREGAAPGSGGAGWEVTGNHYLAFPAISTADGGIRAINVLHRGVQGLLEWVGDLDPEGEPLLAPDLRVQGVPVRLEGWSWEQVDRWIPRFRTTAGPDLHVEGTLCAPAGGPLLLPGAVYLIEVENRGSRELEVEVALAGTWRWSLRTVLSTRPVAVPNRVVRSRTGSGIALEIGGEPGWATLAIVAGAGDESYAAAAGTETPSELGAGDEVAAEKGEALRLRIAAKVRVPPKRKVGVPFYIAAAVERDGALERAADLRAMGGAELIRLGRLALAQMTRRTRDPELSAILNRNLAFNAFFAIGRALDDDRLYPVCSRSALASRSAVFRERDALLWSLPALQLVDPYLAREALTRAFEQYSHRPGANLHYLDGGVLSSAFALDQFCAYGFALDRYVEETGDATILDEPIITEVLGELDDLLLDRLHPKVLLATTELLPSGERADHPYVTFDNVLVWAFSRALERIWPAGTEGAPPNFTGAAEEVASAIWRHCTVEVDGLRVLAWSTDLAGEAAVYDDPEGSLALLPYLGFCDADDPVWRNTIELLHSSGYPFWLGEREYPGMASRTHPETASLAGLCSRLLGPGREDALQVLRGLDLEGGIASETYDPDTGRTAEGPYAAALAGLLAWSLWQALEG